MDETPTEQSESGPLPRRVVKRYSNRKLYDTLDSRYVTLLQIADLVRSGVDVQIIDNATKEDKTDVTLALIISEELKARPRGIPLATLKALIRARGERLLSQLKGGTLGKLISREEDEAVVGQNGSSNAELSAAGASDPEPTIGEDSLSTGFRATLEQWQRIADEQIRSVIPAGIENFQKAVDEQVRAMLPNFTHFRDLSAEVSELRRRVEELERRLDGQSGWSEKR